MDNVYSYSTFLASLGRLIEEYENNTDSIVGVDLVFTESGEYYAWDGERMSGPHSDRGV